MRKALKSVCFPLGEWMVVALGTVESETEEGSGHAPSERGRAGLFLLSF